MIIKKVSVTVFGKHGIRRIVPPAVAKRGLWSHELRQAYFLGDGI